MFHVRGSIGSEDQGTRKDILEYLVDSSKGPMFSIVICLREFNPTGYRREEGVSISCRFT